MSNYSSKIKTEAQNATIYNERYKKDVCEGTCNSHLQFIRNGIYRQQNRKANEQNESFKNFSRRLLMEKLVGFRGTN
jgi:hypothetical protein